MFSILVVDRSTVNCVWLRIATLPPPDSSVLIHIISDGIHEYWFDFGLLPPSSGWLLVHCHAVGATPSYHEAEVDLCAMGHDDVVVAVAVYREVVRGLFSTDRTLHRTLRQ